jgi:hypothetical protein
MIIGKSPDGKIWFKSDQFLKDVTNGFKFQVSKTFFKESWKLWAAFRAQGKNNDGSKFTYTQWELLGIYKSEAEASAALGRVMSVLDIKPIDSADNLF